MALADFYGPDASLSVTHATVTERLNAFEYDYRFDSSKAERALGLASAGYREGIAATLTA